MLLSHQDCGLLCFADLSWCTEELEDGEARGDEERAGGMGRGKNETGQKAKVCQRP